jgi:molybdopterin-guanine dinucleotide biosynthesis protein A
VTGVRLDECSAAVLIGGESRRMGTPTALLGVGSEALICRLLRQIQPAVCEVLLVGNLEIPETALCGIHARRVADIAESRSSLNGLVSAIRHSSTAWTAVFACDAPQPCIPLLEFMCVQAGKGFDAVCCADEKGKLQPFHALWSKSALGALETALESGEMRLHKTLAQVRAAVVVPAEWKQYDAHGEFLWNLNTPEELERFRGLSS